MELHLKASSPLPPIYRPCNKMPANNDVNRLLLSPFYYRTLQKSLRGDLWTIGPI